ncbi:MAG: hypothetical protein ABUL63_05775, partial [Acidobacteriota bacterium]
GKFMSPVAQAIDSPTYAAQKQKMLQYFSSEAELKEYLADADKVTQALRDHIWSLSGGRRQPALANPAGGASVTAGGAGGR